MLASGGQKAEQPYLSAVVGRSKHANELTFSRLDLPWYIEHPACAAVGAVPQYFYKNIVSTAFARFLGPRSPHMSAPSVSHFKPQKMQRTALPLRKAIVHIRHELSIVKFAGPYR